jgi:predicted lysophospholipase L1 biosynthesis ABC-type transport system permease subunit
LRILNILCGISVLFTTLAYAHLLHHHLFHIAPDFHPGAAFWAASIPAVAAGILAFIGGCLLLKRTR